MCVSPVIDIRYRSKGPGPALNFSAEDYGGGYANVSGKWQEKNWFRPQLVEAASMICFSRRKMRLNEKRKSGGFRYALVAEAARLPPLIQTPKP